METYALAVAEGLKRENEFLGVGPVLSGHR